MKTRIELQSTLEELLGSKNVYYQKPPSTGMKYPAILYSKGGINTKNANNNKYSMNIRYEIIVISKTPEHPVINKLLSIPYCVYDRPYISDNLYHDVLTLYY